MTACWTTTEHAWEAGSSPVGGESTEADWRARRHTTRQQTWIAPRGTSNRPLWARVDEPTDGLARGALVIVPSFGREAVVSYRTLSALAVRAARAGFVAITFSFTGDGDSAPLQPDDELPGRWVTDLEAVLQFARDLVGPERPVHAVGLRLGASVLAAASPSPAESSDEAVTQASAPNDEPSDASSTQGTDAAPERRVFWEPISGRSYLLAHRLVRSRTVPVPTVPAGEGTELDGVLLSPVQTAGLSTVAAPRRNRPGVRIERDRAVGARLAVGAPYYATVPHEAIAEIVADLPGATPTPVRSWTPRPSAHLDTPAGEVIETFCAVGPHRLPAIRTSSAVMPARVGLLGTAMGSEIKAGPGNLWATAARDLAPAGVVTLRVDRRFLGDDADPDAVEEPRPYRDEAVEDVAAGARELAAHGLPVVGIGLCAGAWALLRAAGQDAPLRHVIGVNLAHWNPDASVYTEQFYAHYHRAAALETGAAGTDGDEPEDSKGCGDGAGGSARSVAQWSARVVEALRTEFAIRFPRLRSALQPDVPLDLVHPLLAPIPPDCGVTLLLGREDHRIFVGKGGVRAAHRARRRGREVEVVVDPDVDHSLFAERARTSTSRLLRSRLLAIADGDLGPAPAQSPTQADGVPDERVPRPGPARATAGVPGRAMEANAGSSR